MSEQAGNEHTWARDRGLRAIAKQRFGDPMSTWPQHEVRHLRTIMGARLYDSECLRCHLEDVAAAEARKGQTS
jgi:hypothetical protein